MPRRLITAIAGFGVFSLLGKAYERWWFPRDPARTVPQGAAVVAPADGRVVYVANVDEGVVPISIKKQRGIPLHDIVKGRDRPGRGVLIGIFMSPFDVHYQRSPIDGIVREVSYHPAPYNHVMGSMFLRNLFRIQPLHTRSPHITENERNITHIVGEEHEVYVIQIADQQVNKIDCYVAPEDEVAIGQKIGMIRRGSQVDLFIPDREASDFPTLEVGGILRAGISTLLAKPEN
jgi:phosphatidylserine decarboxylase